MLHELSLPRPGDLTSMPLRAIVAYSVRCARRVQPLFRFTADMADFARHEAAVERAIALAERFCIGDESESGTLAAAPAAAASAAAACVAARGAIAKAVTAAACVAGRAAAARGAPARAAAAAAARAAAAADAPAATAAAIDFETLLNLYPRGWFGRRVANRPVDPTEDGPLGPLWPPPVALPAQRGTIVLAAAFG
jgi:hypothetical protein